MKRLLLASSIAISMAGCAVYEEDDTTLPGTSFDPASPAPDSRPIEETGYSWRLSTSLPSHHVFGYISELSINHGGYEGGKYNANPGGRFAIVDAMGTGISECRYENRRYANTENVSQFQITPKGMSLANQGDWEGTKEMLMNAFIHNIPIRVEYQNVSQPGSDINDANGNLGMFFGRSSPFCIATSFSMTKMPIGIDYIANAQDVNIVNISTAKMLNTNAQVAGVDGSVGQMPSYTRPIDNQLPGSRPPPPNYPNNGTGSTNWGGNYGGGAYGNPDQWLPYPPVRRGPPVRRDPRGLWIPPCTQPNTVPCIPDRPEPPPPVVPPETGTPGWPGGLPDNGLKPPKPPPPKPPKPEPPIEGPDWGMPGTDPEPEPPIPPVPGGIPKPAKITAEWYR